MLADPEACSVTVVGVVNTPLAVPEIGTFTMHTAVNVPDIVVDVCDATCHLKKLQVFGSRNGTSSGDTQVPASDGPAGAPPPEFGVGSIGFRSRLDLRSNEQAVPAIRTMKTSRAACAYLVYFMRSVVPLLTKTCSGLSESRSRYFSPARW
jgi:hypothetical protein